VSASSKGLALAPLILAACAEAQFTVDRPRPALVSPAPRVAVVGVYENGRMSAAAWNQLAPFLVVALGSGACEAGFGDLLHDLAPEVYAEVDAATKESGVTPATLGPLAPRATGDLLLVLTTSGRPVQHLAARPRAPGPIGGGMSLGRRRRSSSIAAPARPEAEDPFEVGASLYVTADRTPAGGLTMRYTGDSRDAALKAFAERLRMLIPGAVCSSWK
jgi:hypothetical protein